MRPLIVPPENVLERETEIGAAYVRRAWTPLTHAIAGFDPICSMILTFVARTDKGRAVKKMARGICRS